MTRTSRKPRHTSRRRASRQRTSRQLTSRNPGIDTKVYSVVDRLTGFERRHLTREQAKVTLEAHKDRCARYGWRDEAKVFYRDGTDVTREFRVAPNLRSRTSRRLKRTSRFSPVMARNAKGRKFSILSAERIRPGTTKMVVDVGKEGGRYGEIWITVYPEPLPMRIYAPFSDVQWLESDLYPSEIAKVRKAAERASVTPNQSALPVMRPNLPSKLDRQDRAMINESLIRRGFDGNGRFKSVGSAISQAFDVLDDYGLEPDEVFSAWRFGRPSGSEQIRVAVTNRDDPFSPTAVENSVLSFSWHELREGAFEVIAYMS